MRKIIFLLCFAGFLSSCATAKLTEAGKTVKIVEPELIDVKKCKKIQTILHVNEMKFGGEAPQVVIGDIKNKVGESGANVGATRFDLKGILTSMGGRLIPIGSRIPVETYNCTSDFWETLSGIQ